METALVLLGIATVVLLVDALARKLGLLSPVLLVLVGIALSFVPFVPQITLNPEVVLLGLLPPLLYAAALGASLIDLKAHLSAVLLLSVGLVLFTATGVGLLVSALTEVPFAVAFALGAIVAPPDAVAATAVARAVGLPRQVVTLLEDESLFNDATALVSLRTAVAAAGLASAAPVTAGSVAVDFLLASVGGVAIGLAAYAVLAAVRRRITDTVADTAISFIAPFAAYLPAELVHSSGVIAVVTTGLLLGHQAPVLMSAASRLAERSNWASLQFLLQNSVFLLIGLQVSSLLGEVRESGDSILQTVGLGLVVLLAVIVLRPMWVFPFRWLLTRLRGGEMYTTRPEAAVVSWAGMRGVVTLAAAATLPVQTPHRASLVLIALIVTLGTLGGQGLSLPRFARWLRVQGPDPRADALQAAIVRRATTSAGLRALEGDDEVEPDILEQLRADGERRVDRIWESLGAWSGQTQPPSERYARARLKMLHAERVELLRIRDAAEVDQVVLTTVQSAMDVEESVLTQVSERSSEVRHAALTAPSGVAGDCEHLRSAPASTTPQTSEGCQGCLAEGRTDWIHLRMCLTCGYVGCCNSSPRRHMSRHYDAEQHPVMRSLEPGEAWRWCFVDDLLG